MLSFVFNIILIKEADLVDTEINNLNILLVGYFTEKLVYGYLHRLDELLKVCKLSLGYSM